MKIVFSLTPYCCHQLLLFEVTNYVILPSGSPMDLFSLQVFLASGCLHLSVHYLGVPYASTENEIPD